MRGVSSTFDYSLIKLMFARFVKTYLKLILVSRMKMLKQLLYSASSDNINQIFIVPSFQFGPAVFSREK